MTDGRVFRVRRVERRTVALDGQARWIIDTKDDGSIVLLRATDVDDGAARSVPISAAALPAVARALYETSVSNAFSAFIAAICRALKGISR